MEFNNDTLVSITEPNESYSKTEEEIIADDEEVIKISQRLINKNKEAYEVLVQ